MATSSKKSQKTKRAPIKEGALEAAVLFVDLVNSSTFASVLNLEDYHRHLVSFHEVCQSQCRYHFEQFLQGVFEVGRDYSFTITGDELVVFMHSGRPQNDVYQLACLAITLKAAWLTAERNRERIERRAPVADISAGIHHGPVWAVPKTRSSYILSGYTINVAKRVESLSRHGEHYRLFLSDQAFKQVHHLLRNMIFTPRLRFEVKGIVGDQGMYEVAHSFLDPHKRMDPGFSKSVRSLLVNAITLATQDLWMNDLFQVWSEKQHGHITDEAFELCKRVLRHSPTNPSALYHLAQGYRGRGDLKMAEMILRELIGCWPYFPDGFLDLGRLLRNQANPESDTILRRALYLGVDAKEFSEELELAKK